MKGLSSRALGAVAALMWAAGADRVLGSPPPHYGLGEELRNVVEEEVWRAGGPRPERMLDWLKQAEESGKPEAANAVGEVLKPLFSRRWLDPTPFAEYE